MSGFGDLFGGLFGSNNAGLNYRADRAPIQQAVNTGQTGQAYNQAQQGLGSQMSFLQALQAQNGIQNQSDVYNQLAGVANGTGPNPALAQLQNTTGQNVSNQAALMAGQRGVNANPALIARQIAQQGAGIQQQAVGQGAALQAQQQLGALGAMGNLANTQVNQQGNALMGYNQAAQSEQNALLQALANYNSQNVAMQSNVNNANAGIAGITGQGQQSLIGGGLGAIGQGIAAFAAHGGMVKGYDEGGSVDGPSSFTGRFLKGWLGSEAANPSGQAVIAAPASNPGATALNKGAMQFGAGIGQFLKAAPSLPGGGAAGGGAQVATIAKGGVINGESLASSQKMVPGKASVKGDSYKNDTVPAMLSPGEVVIPKHVMESSDPVGNSAKFVRAILAKQGMRKK